MKRKMQAAKPEDHMKVKDPGHMAKKRIAQKKNEPDTRPSGKVPDKGRPKGGGNSMSEKLKNKYI